VTIGINANAGRELDPYTEIYSRREFRFDFRMLHYRRICWNGALIGNEEEGNMIY